MTKVRELFQKFRTVYLEHPDRSMIEIARIVREGITDLPEAFDELLAYEGAHVCRNHFRDTVERPSTRVARTRSRKGSTWRSSERYAAASAAAKRVEEEWAARIEREGAAAVLQSHRERIIAQFTEALRAEVKLELTPDFLAGEVKLYDGQKPCRWGEMTWEQHFERADRLSRNALGTADTMARHLEAARLINEHGVHCLNEIGQVSGAA